MENDVKYEYAKEACIYGTAVGPSNLYPKDARVIITLADAFTFSEAYALSISSGIHLGFMLIKTSIVASVCNIPPIKRHLYEKYKNLIEN